MEAGVGIPAVERAADTPCIPVVLEAPGWPAVPRRTLCRAAEAWCNIGPLQILTILQDKVGEGADTILLIPNPK